MNGQFTLIQPGVKEKVSFPGLITKGMAEKVVEKRVLDAPEPPKEEEEKPKRILKGTKPRKLL